MQSFVRQEKFPIWSLFKLSSFGFNSNNNNNNKNAAQNGRYNSYSLNRRVRNPYSESHSKTSYSGVYNERIQGAVISGYFVREKSYKEILISRVNTVLCCILAGLVLVCLVCYYFVVVNEIELQKLSKETIALNYDNQDMQNKLDKLQSFSNVDFQVSKTNILQRAKRVIELPAKGLPSVDYDTSSKDSVINWSLGY